MSALSVISNVSVFFLKKILFKNESFIIQVLLKGRFLRCTRCTNSIRSAVGGLHLSFPSCETLSCEKLSAPPNSATKRRKPVICCKNNEGKKSHLGEWRCCKRFGVELVRMNNDAQ